MKTCSIDGCKGSERIVRGWCERHWRRWRKYGDPLGGGDRYADPEEAFIARTEPLLWSGCIVWTGTLSRTGYGSLRVAGKMVRAHRYAWERVHGPIPEGMEIDHVCWERSCVEVSHLRLATRQQNVWNRSGANSERDLPRGVHRVKQGYVAQIGHDGAKHYLGTFPTIAEASAAATTKRKILFGEYAGRA